jgi:hypothetical protein
LKEQEIIMDTIIRLELKEVKIIDENSETVEIILKKSNTKN